MDIKKALLAKSLTELPKSWLVPVTKVNTRYLRGRDQNEYKFPVC